MTDSRPSKSLPPLVRGNVYGHLTVTVDEVLWSWNYRGEVAVLLQWWGDNDSVCLRAFDISKYSSSAKENTSVTYSIQTNISLFETYLRQCNKLNLLVINNDTKEIVGHVEINNLYELITGICYEQYFPIITSSGKRVGDLRVDFELSMSSSVGEGTSSKKMRKRSRKKNKCFLNPFRTVDEEQKSKPIKKGCKACSDHTKQLVIRPDVMENALNLELPRSPTNGQVPLNSELSDSSDCVLLEVFEKGKKLRNAMVLSVLEDSDGDLAEELLLKLDQVEKENTSQYKTVKMHKNGEIITPSEEKLISDYLDGKTMKEEEEVLVLNKLHTEDKHHNPEAKSTEDNSVKQEACCLASKTGCPHFALSSKNMATTGTVIHPSSCTEGEKGLLKKINCFRLTIDCLTLTSAGWKKVNNAVDNKNKNCDMVPPPGATYFVECHFVEDSPRSQAQPWKTTPLRFCSRRQIEDVVYFGQSSAHSLRPPHSLASTQSELAAMNCLVCWRHLNQRLPALLGHFSLGGVLQRPLLETTVCLPVTTDADGTVAHVRLRLELGKDKLYFGHALLEDAQTESITSAKVNDEDRIVRIKEIPLNVKDLCNRNKSHQADTKSCTRNEIVNSNAKILTQRVIIDENSLPNYTNIPLCTNCDQNLVLTNVQNSPGHSLCVSCTNQLDQHQSQFIEPNFKISIPKNFAAKEQRHHEFLLGIDTVIGFPLFAQIQDELSCYVDYRFPEITSGLKAEMSRSETTSRVVPCEAQPSFLSVHSHELPLPVVLPLSPLLAASSPGITLNLWLRYFKPTPRDHMVAMALLPMNELCLLELEFDKKKQKAAVIKVLELPLALVKSSVTAPYHQYHNLGVLRLSVTYSNYISSPHSHREYHPVTTAELGSEFQERGDPSKEKINQDIRDEIPTKEYEIYSDVRNLHTLPNTKYLKPECSFEQGNDPRPTNVLLDKVQNQNDKLTEEGLRATKNRFWTGPFGKEKFEKQNHVDIEKRDELQNQKANCTKRNSFPVENVHLQNNITSFDVFNNILDDDTGQNDKIPQECSRPVMKEDFDILTENLEQRINQLQNDLMKERQRGFTEVDNVVLVDRKSNSVLNDDVNDDFLSFHSLSSNSSMESLPFILGPPADFKDVQNTLIFSQQVKRLFSDSHSDKSGSDTISGFLKEEKNLTNLGSNESFENGERKSEKVRPKTFKANVKVDRAVNLKAVKTPCNGKKGKVPPSTWVSFGTGDCCEQNCGTGGLVCTGRRYTTPVVRRNYNPIWNLTWDIDLPVDYLQQVNKRLVFRVFEENLDVAFGFASANLSILTSGLPSLSSWLSINDLAGACKGQIKIVVTPLEDVSRYQECSVFDTEEDEFEESKEKKPESILCSQNGNKGYAASFVASQTEIFVNKIPDDTSKDLDAEVEQLMNCPDNTEREDPFSADDVISDYKNTLENNFRNEMAGLENLIKFLRVGSMSNELSFLRASENKENLSSNPTNLYTNTENRTLPHQETGVKIPNNRATSLNSQAFSENGQRDRILKDASTETMNNDENPSSSNQNSSEDILSKLLQQISMFQLPTIKITDNTCQTVTPETKESFTETNVENQNKPLANRTLHMKDNSTETDDICDNRFSQSAGESHTSQSPHICGELGSVLLQHFLTCKPAPVKMTDSACQTVSQDKVSTANSSGVFSRSQPSGMSTEILVDSIPGNTELSGFMNNWISPEVHSNSERLNAIDNNIKDLERLLKKNLIMANADHIFSTDSNEESSCESLNGVMDSIQASVKGNSRSSSDVESLGSTSQILAVPRETPDGGNPLTVPDTQNSSNTDNTVTKMTRQGTFVIEKAKDNSEETSIGKFQDGANED